MRFHDLHYSETPFVLPIAWDTASGIAFQRAGFRAIGTTSHGVGATYGESDAAVASKRHTAVLVAALKKLPVFVSADIEDGYDDSPAAVGHYVAGLEVDGITVADSTFGGLVDTRLHAAKISAVKRCAPRTFVNARIDSYWLGQDATFPEVLERATAYVMAGADGIFVPGVTALEDFAELAREIAAPLCAMTVPDLTLEQLAGAGVRRICTGTVPYREALHTAVTVASAIRANELSPLATPYPETAEQESRVGA